MKQELIDEFYAIHKSNRISAIASFLQKLTPKERKEMASILRKMPESTIKRPGKEIFFISCLACCTQNQFKNLTRWYNGNPPEQTDEILVWNCPSWLSDHYNQAVESNLRVLDYDTLCRWQLKGYFTPSPLLIARSLAGAPHRKEHNKVDTNFIEKNSITLNEHIWTLFQNQSMVNYYTYACNSDTGKHIEKSTWVSIFKKYTSNGRIDRLRVLRESLLSVNYDLGRDITGWFMDLFIDMAPTTEELLFIQDELFGTFNCTFTKPINRSLDNIKQIATYPDFKTIDFLGYLPVLLSSEAKSIVVSTLAILDKILKEKPGYSYKVCKEAAIAFLHKDESIQTKTARLIVKYGTDNSAEIINIISSYDNNILMSVKAIFADLPGWPNPANNPEQNTATTLYQDNPGADEAIPIINETNSIAPICTIDDLVFFLSQAFTNGEPINLDLLPDALIRLNEEITGDHLPQFEIALRKAYEISARDPFWYSYNYHTKEFEDNYFRGEGQYCRMLAVFFINYCRQLAERFPQSADTFRQIDKEGMEMVKRAGNKNFFDVGPKVSPLSDWYGKDFKLLQPYLSIFTRAQHYIDQNIDLPLLSTPTHYPAWITQEAFNERLSRYNELQQEPDEADLQLALSRRVPGMEDEMIDQVKKHCSTYSWKTTGEKKQDSTYTDRSYIEVNIPTSPWEKEKNLYAGIGDNIRYYISYYDIDYLCFMFPSIPAIPYSLLTRDRFEFAQIPNAETRDMIQIGISVLYESKINIDPMTTLFLACCMLCSEKNIRNYAAEIWLERSINQQIDNRLLGQTLGTLLDAEWAPVKRLTDMAVSNFLSASPQHNVALQQTVEAVLSHITRPVTNLKKLLEIYNELLALNHAKANAKEIPRLQTWKTENSLKKVVKQIMEK